MIGQGPGCLGPEETCTQQCRCRTTPSPLRSQRVLSQALRCVPPREWGACVCPCWMLDQGSRFGFLFTLSPKRGPRAQLSWARPLPDAHIRVQLSSMFPSLPGPSLPQRGIGLGRGRGQCPMGAAPTPSGSPRTPPRFSPRPFPLH